MKNSFKTLIIALLSGCFAAALCGPSGNELQLTKLIKRQDKLIFDQKKALDNCAGVLFKINLTLCKDSVDNM